MPNKRTFADLDFNFTPHPDSGDLLRVYDNNAITQAIRSLVLTEFYGRPYHPEIGSSAAGLLFELRTPLLDLAIQTSIINVIENNEPRAEVQHVEVSFDDSNQAYNITVYLFLKALMQQLSVDLILQRIR